MNGQNDPDALLRIVPVLVLVLVLIRDPKPLSNQRNYNRIYNHPSPVPDAPGPRIGEIAHRPRLTPALRRKEAEGCHAQT